MRGETQVDSMTLFKTVRRPLPGYKRSKIWPMVKDKGPETQKPDNPTHKDLLRSLQIKTMHQ